MELDFGMGTVSTNTRASGDGEGRLKSRLEREGGTKTRSLSLPLLGGVPVLRGLGLGGA